MNTARLKQVLAVILGVLAMAGTWLTLARLGDLVEATGTGADVAAGYTPAIGAVDAGAVGWDPDAPGLARPVDDGLRGAIAESYLSALAILDGEHRMDGVSPEAYLTGPALQAAAGSATVEVIERRHHLRVLFHSADGQLVELADRASLTVDAGSGERLVRAEAAILVMVQVDGSWHLRHRVVTDTALTPVEPAAGPTTLTDTAIDAASDAFFFGDWSGIRTVAVPAVVAAVAVASAASLLVTRARTKHEQG